MIILTLSVLFIGFFSYKGYEPEQLDPPYEDYFQVTNQLKKHLDKETSLVIAHQGLAQIIIISDPVDATNWQPSQTSDYKNTVRIVANIPYYFYKKHLIDNSLYKVSHLYKSYYLMPENVWQQFKHSVNKSDNNSLKEKLTDWYNPSESKPQYLLKGRKKEYIH